MVTMEGFGNFLSWFGPMLSDQLPPLMERVPFLFLYLSHCFDTQQL